MSWRETFLVESRQQHNRVDRRAQVFAVLAAILLTGCTRPCVPTAAERPATSAAVVEQFLAQNPTDSDEVRPRRFRHVDLVIDTFQHLHMEMGEEVCRDLASSSVWLPEKPYEGEEDFPIHGALTITGHNTTLVITISADGFFVGHRWRELFYNEPLALAIEKEVKHAMEDPDVAKQVRASDDKWLWQALRTCQGAPKNTE